MPNVKLYVDERCYEALRPRLAAVMAPFRDALCRELGVPVAACQLAALPVLGMEGQAEVNCEIQYLALPERSPEVVRAAMEVFGDLLEAALGQRPAMRAAPLDPVLYIKA